MRIIGITTYNPNIERLARNVEACSRQCDLTYVWDNGSSNYDEVSSLLSRYGAQAQLDTVHSNIGVGAALNNIVAKASESGCEWVLLLDQDSIPSADLYDALYDYTAPGIAIVAPRIVDMNRRYRQSEELPEVEEYLWPITSGSLVNVAICERLGRFDEQLFIDFVDDEYSIRVILNGYRCLQANHVLLRHEIGHLKEVGIPYPHFENHRIVFRRSYSSGHPPIRHYYQVRNLTYLHERYGKSLTQRGITLPSVKTFIVHSLLFEDNKAANLREMLRALRDEPAFAANHH